MTADEKYMKEALRQAKKALALGEVPIGCVIVQGEKIIARGYNRRNTDRNTLSHAELNAIRKASRRLGDWRLEDCTMYITLEPCQMCAGAIVQARIPRVVLGSMNPKAGCAGSVLNILQTNGFNHHVEITKGVLLEECSEILGNFFRDMRDRQRQANSSKTFLRRLRDQLPGYQVKEVKPADIWEIIPGYIFYTGQTASGEPTVESWEKDIGGTSSNISLEKKTCVVLYKKGRCAAVIDFLEDYPEKKRGFISLFSVSPEIHSRGIGAKLFKHFSAAAAAVGIEWLQLNCFEVNEVGLSFWRDRGFHMVKEIMRDGEALFVIEEKIEG